MALKIGIIGAGRTGNNHASCLKGIKDVEVVAISDVNRKAAKSLASLLKANVYSDYKKMYKEEELDCVFVCTPIFARGEQLRMAAEKGLHIFVEKPVAINQEEGEKNLTAVENAGIICSVGYQWRYSKLAEKILKIVGDKRMALIDAHWFHTIPPPAWVRSKEKAGGQIVDQSTHLIDFMRYIVGEVKTVYAQGTKGLFSDLRDFTADDASAATLVFESGTVANLSSTYSLFPGATSVKMDFATRGLRVEIAPDETTVYRPEEGKFNVETHLKGNRSQTSQKEKFKTGIKEGRITEDKVFVEAIRKKDPTNIKSDYKDGLKTLKVTLAANKSIDTGEVIHL